MAKIKITLDTRRALADGTYPIKLSVFINNKGRTLINVGITILEKQWNGAEVISHPMKARYNTTLRYRMNKADDALMAMEVSGELEKLTMPKIKERIAKTINGAPKEDNKPSLLIATAFEAFANNAATEGTKSVYRQTAAKLSRFYDLDTLSFNDITAAWLREFEGKMRADKLSVNGMSIHLRNLRAVINRAIDDELIENYPFRKFKIKSEQTRKRALTVEQLRTLRDYDCQEHQRKYRDLFLLTFYLVGINPVDLFALKEISENGRIEFDRAKTGRLYSVKIEPEAREIIERYRGENYLINVCDNYGNYKDFTRRMNASLKLIGPLRWIENGAKDPSHVKRNKKHITALFPELSIYWARHTWATIAAELDVPDETISLALGHAGANSTTNIYINRNQRKVDDANRRVLDMFRIEQKEEPKE